MIKSPCDLARTEMSRSETGGVALLTWDFTPQEPWRLRMWVFSDAAVKPADIERVTLEPLDEDGWKQLQNCLPGENNALRVGENADFAALKKRVAGTREAVAFICPRGIGATAWSGTKKEQTQRLRRFYLLGQTLDGMRVWDIRRGIAALRETPFGKAPLQVIGSRASGVNVLYAALCEDGIAGVEMREPQLSHSSSPIYLNVLRVMDIPQALAAVAMRTNVTLTTANVEVWAFPKSVLSKFGRTNALEIHPTTGGLSN